MGASRERGSARRVQLKPLKKEGKRNPFAVVDLEVEKWVHFVVGGTYSPEYGIHHFTSLKKLLDHCLEVYDGWDVFAHFGGKFDFLFFLETALKYGYEVTDFIPLGSSILSFTLSRGRHRVVFRDSSRLLPFSLRRLCENFKVAHPKLDFDYTAITRKRFKRNARVQFKIYGEDRLGRRRLIKKYWARLRDHLLEYLDHDLKGLHECLETFYSWPLISRSGPAFTLAGQAMRVLRTLITQPLDGLNERVDSFVRSAYFGGRVEIFRPVFDSSPRGPRRIYCYDVNSLYPTQMLTHDMPNGFLYFTDQYEEKAIGFYDCFVTVPANTYVPALGVVRDGKYIFPAGSFSGRFSTAEINYARSLGYEIRTARGAIFKNGGPFFRDYVKRLYAIRETAEKDSVDDILAKLLLNSCYGRTGLRLDRENICFDDGSEGLKEWLEISLKGRKVRIMKKPVKLRSFSNVAIAAWVTAQARIHMHKLYLQHQESIYYTDTDSLFISKELPSGKALGDLKLEYSRHSAVFLLPKTYITQSGSDRKVTMKGFEKKKIRKFTFEDFKNFLEGDLKYLRVTQEPRFATFKTALRQGKLVTMTKRGTKEIRSAYDKREVYQTRGGKYETRPIILKESPDDYGKERISA